ncbi:MAB_1171c family putative transporter [Streptomyces sp. O3]
MSDTSYYIPAIVLWTALLFKVPTLTRRWRDPLLWSLCALVLLAGMVFATSAPPTVRAVNSLTGIPNFTAPMAYTVLSMLSAACLILLIGWHGGPMAGRAITACVICYGAVSVALFVLFFLGDAPVERDRDFDTYYANTPYLREMIVLYLVAFLASCVGMSLWCWRWSRQVGGWLKGSLILLAVTFTITLVYSVTKLVAVFARWNGTDWDVLSTYVAPPMAAVGGTFCTVGFLLPMAAPQLAAFWQAWRAYWCLGPLMRELNYSADKALHEVTLAPWASPVLRVTQRETAIHDGLLRLSPLLDREVHAQACDEARRSGSPERAADIVGSAAMIAAAVQAERQVSAGAGGVREPVGAFNRADLTEISRAMRGSPIVARFRHQWAGAGEGRAW